MKKTRVHLGCGPGPLAPGWTHLDGSWHAWLSKHRVMRSVALKLTGHQPDLRGAEWSEDVVIHNLLRPLPFETGSVSAIYSSHVLEHLYFADAQQLLRECHRVLQSGGLIRFVVPDLASIVARYHNSSHESRADELLRGLHLRQQKRNDSNVFLRLYDAFCDFHSHKWMYDQQSLSHRMREAGFAEVASRGIHDSEIEGIQAIERDSRICNGEGICVEARKPLG